MSRAGSVSSRGTTGGLGGSSSSSTATTLSSIPSTLAPILAPRQTNFTPTSEIEEALRRALDELNLPPSDLVTLSISVADSMAAEAERIAAQHDQMLDRILLLSNVVGAAAEKPEVSADLRQRWKTAVAVVEGAEGEDPEQSHRARSAKRRADEDKLRKRLDFLLRTYAGLTATTFSHGKARSTNTLEWLKVFLQIVRWASKLNPNGGFNWADDKPTAEEVRARLSAVMAELDLQGSWGRLGIGEYVDKWFAQDVRKREEKQKAAKEAEIARSKAAESSSTTATGAGADNAREGAVTAAAASNGTSNALSQTPVEDRTNASSSAAPSSDLSSTHSSPSNLNPRKRPPKNAFAGTSAPSTKRTKKAAPRAGGSKPNSKKEKEREKEKEKEKEREKEKEKERTRTESAQPHGASSSPRRYDSTRASPFLSPRSNPHLQQSTTPQYTPNSAPPSSSSPTQPSASQLRRSRIAKGKGVARPSQRAEEDREGSTATPEPSPRPVLPSSHLFPSSTSNLPSPIPASRIPSTTDNVTDTLFYPSSVLEELLPTGAALAHTVALQTRMLIKAGLSAPLCNPSGSIIGVYDENGRFRSAKTDEQPQRRGGGGAGAVGGGRSGGAGSDELRSAGAQVVGRTAENSVRAGAGCRAGEAAGALGCVGGGPAAAHAESVSGRTHDKPVTSSKRRAGKVTGVATSASSSTNAIAAAASSPAQSSSPPPNRPPPARRHAPSIIHRPAPASYSKFNAHLAPPAFAVFFSPDSSISTPPLALTYAFVAAVAGSTGMGSEMTRLRKQQGEYDDFRASVTSSMTFFVEEGADDAGGFVSSTLVGGSRIPLPHLEAVLRDGETELVKLRSQLRDRLKQPLKAVAAERTMRFWEEWEDDSYLALPLAASLFTVYYELGKQVVDSDDDSD